MDALTTTATIREALVLMDKIGIGLVTVVDEERKVVGILSDGDIRRGLLRGVGIDDAARPCVNTKFISVGPDASRAAVLDLLKARHFRQIPIISPEGILLGVHTLEAILGVRERPNWAIVMAGGQGMRLRPITESIPKPMITVAGRPILERILLHLIGFGIRKVFFSVNYLAPIIEEHFGDGSRFGCEIHYLHEDTPLGSGGALGLLPTPEHPVVVMNGDLITDVDIGKLIECHEANDYYATMGTKQYQHQVPFGCLEVDENNRIMALEEKPLLNKLVNAGVYVLSPPAIASVPKNTFFPITTIFDQALKQGLPCGTLLLENEWLDVGQPADLKRALGSSQVS